MLAASNLENLAYLVASVLFIVGLKRLSHPRTAVSGNQIGAVGMLLAVVAVLLSGGLHFLWIVIGLICGSAAGAYLAVKTPMTGMPQMVALLNGYGGAASFLVAGAEQLRTRFSQVAVVPQSGGTSTQAAEVAAQAVQSSAVVSTSVALAIAAAGLIGSVTLFGSLVAYAKLAELSLTWKGRKIGLSRSIVVPGGSATKVAAGAACILLCFLLLAHPLAWWWYWLLVVSSAILGLLLTLPIGGADMPVVIALLNSYSGIAASATGFVIGNNVLIVAGSLVGASGIILTSMMCKAMNRSLLNVTFATLGPKSDTPSADQVYEGKIKSVSAEELAMILDGVQKVLIVPGYGLAVSQAQHSVRDFANLLASRGAEVVFGIHPVAGRMPGHMNVLLAEADVPYDKLLEMDEVNGMMDGFDVAMVIGANDVVNPDARKSPDQSPIGGMPIIDVDRARTVIVVKRSLSPGYAGIPNPLFANDNTLMYFQDGKKAFLELTTAMKAGG